MNKTNLRLKNSKKGITPVIATIILIAGTLVLGLVVGAYTFGLFGSNVKTITLTSGNLYAGIASGANAATCEVFNAGKANLQIALTNPGSATTVTAFSLSGSSVVPVSAATAFTTVGGACVAMTGVGAPTVNGATAAGSTTSMGIFLGQPLTSGNQYNYVITFANGQSVSGTLIAS